MLAIEECCLPAYKDRVKECIKVIPIDSKQIDLIPLAHDLSNKFIEDIFMRPI